MDIFAWSIDLKGGHNVYDEPPGSLELLPFYGFCGSDDEIYKNTVDVIRDKNYPYSFAGCTIDEIGCAHAPHPWILSLANSLLCGRRDHARDILYKTAMDNGIACESVDENTGECATGAAFATCAGFLAYAIYYTFKE
jgi:meiotically up-regulated gene 157 (Mug157) protein